MAGQQPKRHHSVPDFYLKRFASPPRKQNGAWQVSAYNREIGKLLLRTSTGNVTVENRLYEIQNSAHDERARLESWLSEQEDIWARTLNKVSQRRYVEQHDIPELRRFIAYSYTRSTAYAERLVRNAGPYFRTDGVQNLRREGPPEGVDQEWIRNFWAHLDAIESGEVRLEEDPDFALRHQFPPPDGLFDGLATGWSYVVVFSSQGRFLTSDVPVVVRRVGATDYGVIPDVGLANASDLWVPLDPYHALLLTRDHATPRWVGEIPSREIRAWNSAVSHVSHRWTVWMPDTPARMFVDLPHVQSLS